MRLPDDPLWPRASAWLADGTLRWAGEGVPDVGLLGVPAHLTSISPTNADQTPAAVRAALGRYSTWSESTGTDLRQLWAVDLGDVGDPDGPVGESRTMEAVGAWPGRLLVALGGDNSVTYAVARGVSAAGLVTLDAHHDLRDGVSNGSPVRRLLEAGMSGQRIVQIGLADFSNSGAYAARARDAGITLFTRAQVEQQGIGAVMAQALAMAGAGPGPVHVDLDVDVCDRSVVPACPAAAPGGLSAWELRSAARAAGADSRVTSLDLCEVDATADAADERTVRLVALCVLEAAAGVALRPRT
jgi:formiminoglutamase